MILDKFESEEISLGNVIALEHINLAVPSQELATIFYITGLGLTRDPYMSVGHQNMWVNIGYQQFHLPTRNQQKIPGTIGLTVPSLADLSIRLENIAPYLKETEFKFESRGGELLITCPWGNQIVCSDQGVGSSLIALGIRFIKFDVPVGCSEKIGKFYSSVLQASVQPVENEDGVSVKVGNGQVLLFKETTREMPVYDGHHIAIYLNDFNEVYSSLDKLSLITEVTSEFQYRFEDIVDVDSGDGVLKLEHEVRSIRHPMYQRDLVNRNPNQGFLEYVSSEDRFM